MSFLFDKRTKRVVHTLWAVVAVLVIAGMVLVFAPGIMTLLAS